MQGENSLILVEFYQKARFPPSRKRVISLAINSQRHSTTANMEKITKLE
jgi:hypothetical protein